ncbi:DNA damage-binding protein 1 [Hypsibius exemplaris]|uniref:DNA damage-binding protein 1 n=1 Tax=Hypsibius exemplaris TaxID=2072580 RepID=A0A1W0X2M0_HYPEX|nr:DNA damage-binding protein 1 [Hypsibius exemplaris]
MANNYIATAHPSALVKFSAFGHFVNDKQQHLLTVKSRSLELFALEGEELVELKKLPIPCTVTGFWSFRPKNHGKDVVVVLSRGNELAVFELISDLVNGIKIQTRWTGKFPAPEELKMEPLAVFHPEQRFMCLALYAQRLEIVEFSADLKTLKCFPIRYPSTDGSRILGMDFLSRPGSAASDSMLAVLQTTRLGHSLAFCNLNIKIKEKEKPVSTYSKLDPEVSLMLAIPGNDVVPPGAIAIGNSTIQYSNTSKQPVSVASPFLTKIVVTAHCVLFKDPVTGVISYLLGGADGRLVLVVVRLNTKPSPAPLTSDAKWKACRINVEFIGVATAAQTLTVVGHGLVYLGAATGPVSLLIKLREASRNPETKFYYDILQTFTGLGSILELHVVRNVEKQSLEQASLLAVTADTFGKGLTIVRNSINLQDPVDVPVSGMQKAWVTSSPESAGTTSRTFVLSDFTSTCCCTLDKDDFCETDPGGDLILTSRTILFHQLSDSLCLQVISSAVRLLKWPQFELVQEWRMENLAITVASLLKHVLVVANGCTIHMLHITSNAILPLRTHTCTNEICALELFADHAGDQFIATGEWITSNVSIIQCSTMALIQENIQPTGDVLPRSLMFCRFSEEISYFFVGRGDGNVDYFIFDETNKEMTEHKRIPLGTRLVTFIKFRAQGQVNVFACSDRPSVISCRNGKLLFSNVNIRDAVDVCPFEVTGDLSSSDDLMVVRESSISMGHLEDIQKIHFIPQHLGFQVFRLSLDAESPTVAAIGDKKDCRSNKFAIHKSPECVDERLLYILDRHSFEIITTFQSADPMDCLSCLCHWRVAGRSFLVVGTETERQIPDRTEKKGDGLEKKWNGHLIVLELINDKLQIIYTYTTTEESVRNVASYGDLLLAATDNALLTFEWLGHQLDEPNRLETGGSLNCHLDVVDDTVMLGDVQKSVVLAKFNSTTRAFEVTATDYTNYSFVSLMQRNNQTVMGGDDRGNLMVLATKKSENGEGDVGNQQALEPTSWISFGDPVTSIKRGSLVSPESIGDVSVRIVDSFVFGTSKGQLGIIFELEDDVFKLLKHIEAHLINETQSLGAMDLASSLRFNGRLMEQSHAGFVDGDLLKLARDMRSSELEAVLGSFKLAPENANVKNPSLDVGFVQKILDDLSRLH